MKNLQVSIQYGHRLKGEQFFYCLKSSTKSWRSTQVRMGPFVLIFEIREKFRERKETGESHQHPAGS